MTNAATVPPKNLGKNSPTPIFSLSKFSKKYICMPALKVLRFPLASPPDGPPSKTPPALSVSRAPPPQYHFVRKNKGESSRKSSPPPASPPLLPVIAPPPERPSRGRVVGFGAGPGPGPDPPMASTEQEAAVEAAAVVEEVTRQQGKGCGVAGGGDTVGSWRNIDIAWRKADEAGESRCISLVRWKKIACFCFCKGNLHLLMGSTYSI
jgi:hypothetical protein